MLISDSYRGFAGHTMDRRMERRLQMLPEVL